MSLIKDLKIQNVVILANLFNPSIFSSNWLINKVKICEEQDILPGQIFAPNVAQLSTNDFQLLVLQDRLQFANMIGSSMKFDDLINEKLIPIISTLPEVPYVNAGLNFHWFVEDSESSIPELSRKFFDTESSAVVSKFKGDDVRFGYYLSKDIGNVRLRLDVKPVAASFIGDVQSQREYIQFSFNYDLTLTSEKRVETLSSFLRNYQEYYDESMEIMECYE